MLNNFAGPIPTEIVARPENKIYLKSAQVKVFQSIRSLQGVWHSVPINYQSLKPKKPETKN